MTARLAAVFAQSREERGATAVEYALMAGSIALVIMGAVVVLGGNVGGIFAGFAAQLQSWTS